MNMQDLQKLSDKVMNKTGLAFHTTYFMDGTIDLKMNDQWVFDPEGTEPYSGGAKNLEEVAAFFNGLLFGWDI